MFVCLVLWFVFAFVLFFVLSWTSKVLAHDKFGLFRNWFVFKEFHPWSRYIKPLTAVFSRYREGSTAASADSCRHPFFWEWKPYQFLSPIFAIHHFFPQTKIDLGKSSESTASQWETSFDYTTWLFWLRGLRPCIFMIMAASPWSRNPNSSNTGSKGDGRAKWLHGVSDWTDPNDIPWSNLPFPLVYRLRQVEVWVLNFWKMSVSKGHHLTNWLREWRHKGWENLQRRSPQVLTCQLFSCVDGWGWSFWKKFIPTIWVFIFHRSQTKRASKIRGKHAC